MTDEPATPISLCWTNPAAAEDRPTLVRLTPTALTLATLPAADLDKVRAALDRGEDVAGTVIPLSAVTGAEGDDDDAELTVSYRAGPSKIETATIPFADAAKRQELLVALAAAMGPGWQHRREPISRWKAGFWIALVTAVLALITWGLHAEATLIAEGKGPVNWGKGGRLRLLAGVAHWVEEKLGPTGVLAAGGTLVGLGALVFLIVLASPPLRVVLGPAREPT